MSATSFTPTVRSATASPLPDRRAPEVGRTVGVFLLAVRAALLFEQLAGGVADLPDHVVLRGLRVRLVSGAHGEWSPTLRAEAVSVAAESDDFGPVLFGPARFAGRHGSDEAVAGVFVLGDLCRLAAVKLRRRDAEALGGLYSLSELSVCFDSSDQKGMSVPPRLTNQQAPASSSNCCSLSLSMRSSKPSSSSSGSTRHRRTRGSKPVSPLKPKTLSRSCSFPSSSIRIGCSALNARY